MTRTGKDRLGRGLGALLGDYLDEEPSEGEVRHLALRSIVPNPMQPRREFSDADLDELAASIKEHGLLQPLVVRPSMSVEGRFELVAGERRLRSAQRLGWETIPALVREVDDEALLVLALVENLQREELNPLDEAEGFQALVERFELSHQDIARAVGKDRSTIANSLRLLGLPPSIRKLLGSAELTMGHARALLGVADPVRASEMARRAVAEGWSVRETERRVREGRNGAARTRTRDGKTPRDPLMRALEEALQARLGTRVRIRGRAKGGGTIEVPFHDPSDFERLFALITGVEASEVIE